MSLSIDNRFVRWVGLMAFSLMVGNVEAAPEIQTQPKSINVLVGERAAFSVEATGTGTISYIWYHGNDRLVDGPRISGASTPVLTIDSVTVADDGAYYVSVEDDDATLESEIVELKVTAPIVAPSILTQPMASVIVTEGETASFNVKATGDQPLNYQWFRDSAKVTDGGDILGSTTATLKLSNVTPAQAGSYTVTISNDGGTITSTASKLIVNKAATNGPSDNWTVLVYGNADHNLSPSLITDMLEMERVGSGGGLNIVVQADFDGSSNRNQGLDPSLAKGVTRFLMAKNPDQTERKLISQPVERLDESNNMDDPKVLEAFITWGVKKYPAKNYAIIFWDHGGQWQGFGGDTQDGTDKSPGGLSTAQIRAAVENTKASTQVEKWSFMGFDTCLMGGVEVLYDFAPLTDVFIACPEIDFGDGWNYEILESLRQTPTITPLEFGKGEVESWRGHHSSNESDVKLAAHTLYDLTKFNAFEQTYRTFSAAVNQNSSAIQKTLATIRRDTTSYSVSDIKKLGDPTDYVDLGELADRLQRDNTMPEAVRLAAAAMNTRLDAMVFAKVLGSEKTNAHGLSIFYPVAGSANNAGYLGLTASKVNGTEWPLLLASVSAASSADSGGPSIEYSDSSLTPGGLVSRSASRSLRPGQVNNLSFRVGSGEDIYSYAVSLIDPTYTGKTNEFVFYGEIANRRAASLGTYKLQWDCTIPAFKDSLGNPVFLGGFYDDPLSSIMVSFADYTPPGDDDTQLVTLLTETSGNKLRIVAALDAEAGTLAPEGIDLEPGGILQPVYFMERRNGTDPEKWEEDAVYSKNRIVIPSSGLSGVPVVMAPVPAGAYSVEIQASDVFNHGGDIVEYDLVVGPLITSAPKLTVSADVTGKSITVAWSATATAFKLQRLSELGGVWTDVPDNLFTNQNDLKIFKATADTGSGFFRLRSN